MSKATKVKGGFAVKRKARLPHWCSDCDLEIEAGDEYYELKQEHYRGYYTKHICEDCWKGPKLEA